MILRIIHRTTYDYDRPVPYALQQIRLTPKNGAGQQVRHWQTTVSGGKSELSFEDCHRNRVDLISFLPGTRQISVVCEGEVAMTDTHGIVGVQGGFMPLWMFLRPTALTRAGGGVRRLAQQVQAEAPLARMHALMAAIGQIVCYEPGSSTVSFTAEDTLLAGHGVCQDMAHIFVAAARQMGVPARYVSGYLMMNDRILQEATHAWAEVHLPDLGWVGFDPSNGISPDSRYVRVATGLDYAEAAPVTGTRFGLAAESLTVTVEVQKQ
jgi:transglutaminase-like putative cysteine protease